MFRKVLLLATLITLSGCDSTPEALSFVDCNSFEQCVASISSRVHDNAKWICDQHSNDKSVKVNASISRSGYLERIEIIQASNDDKFDLAAIKAVQNSAPFIEVSQLTDSEYQDASDIIFTFQGNISDE